MKLIKLIEDYLSDTSFDDDLLETNINGVVDDSRLVKSGYLFVATSGYNVDHFDYIDDAIKRGCSFIICDKDIENSFPHLVVNKINLCYIELCKKFYDVNLDDFKFIGITGTDGKTTTTSIIKELIEDCAYLGTNGLSVLEANFSTNNTTPCIDELYRDLSIVKEFGCEKVSMEVSSEALLHDRLNGFLFDIIGFTNITGDHLNVHKSFENYVMCKMKLLNLLKADGVVVINGDDENLKKIKHSNKISFGFNDYNDILIKNVTYSDGVTSFNLLYKDSGEFVKINSLLRGQYNIYNVSMAYIICREYGMDSDVLIKRISSLGPIKGRGELLDFGQDYLIVLDYAHTINGIKSILDAYSDYNIITVTGCAGGREKDKRKIIGPLVMDKSKISIFTMDDPRYEDVDSIIDDMVGSRSDYFRIVDREDAIYYALSIAKRGDCVLILGKGRDEYMAIKDKKITYSDYAVISNYFKENGV